MADEISRETIKVLNEGIFSTEELILFDESDNEGEFMELNFIMFLLYKISREKLVFTTVIVFCLFFITIEKKLILFSAVYR